MPSATLVIKQWRLRCHWPQLVLTVLLCCLFVALANWQLSRAEVKHLDNQQRISNIAADRLLIADAAALAVLSADGLPVMVVGRYLNNKSLLLAKQHYQGQLGEIIFTPFELAGTNDLLLINRGWRAIVEQPVAIISVKGVQHLSGSLVLAKFNAFFLPEKLSTDTWPVRLHHMNGPSIINLLGDKLAAKQSSQGSSPYILTLEEGSSGLYNKYWSSSPQQVKNSHKSYAMQWFAMALLSMLIYILVNSNTLQLIKYIGESSRQL